MPKKYEPKHPRPVKPLPYTREEIRDQFLDRVWGIIAESKASAQRVTLGLDKKPIQTDPVELAVFSILALLDGCTGAMPGMLMIPNPHPNEKAYCISHGDRYYPDPKKRIDIGGELHEFFHQRNPNKEVRT